MALPDEPVTPEPTDEVWAREDEENEDLPGLLPVVGWQEKVSFPDWEVRQIPARCATNQERSSLHASIRQLSQGRVALQLGQGELELPVHFDEGDLALRLLVEVAGVQFSLAMQLVATSGTPFVVLGRDALAGRFLVDPSRSWLGGEA